MTCIPEMMPLGKVKWLAFWGLNGSGKTTTFYILVGLGPVGILGASC